MSAPLGVYQGDNLSAAWQNTVVGVSRAHERKMFHTVTQIDDPTTEVPAIRSAIDELLTVTKKSSVETVANTIFPAALARVSSDTVALCERYVNMYPQLKRFNGSHKGTYFGRLVAYPSAGHTINQLDRLIATLRKQASNPGPMSTGYEVAIDEPDEPSATATVYVPAKDTNARAFPCLSFCSFQLDHGSLLLVAHYRYEYLISKGYGNYLGLARLQGYVAESAGLKVGRMTVVTGRALVDEKVRRVENFLDGLPL